MNTDIRKMFKEKLGWDFSTEKKQNEGLTWDNAFNAFGKIILKTKSNRFIIKKKDDRYKIEFFINDKLIEEGKWNKIGSFNSCLADLAMFDEKMNIEAKGIPKKMLVEKFLGENHISSKTIDNMKAFYSFDGSGFISMIHTEQDFTFEYLKRINSMFYKYLRLNNQIKEIEVLDKLVIPSRKALVDIEYALKNIFSKIANLKKIPITFGETKPKNVEKKLKGNSSSPLTIKEIINGIKNGEITIPVFQREYVWDENKIIALLNTISKGFPMGSILMAKSELDFASKNEILEAIKSNNKKPKESIIVMDGQQRITSILLIFAYRSIFRVMSMTVSKELELIMNRVKNVCFFEDKFYKSLELISTKKVKKDDIGKYLISKNDFGLMELFGNYEISTSYISDLKLEYLLDIFKNINISSTNLTTIDLLHSAFYGQLTHPNLLGSLKMILNEDNIKNFKLPKEWLVQAIKVIVDYNKYIKIQDMKIKDKFSIEISNTAIFGLAAEKITAIEFFKELKNISNLLNKVFKVLNQEMGIHAKQGIPNMSFFFSTLLMIKKYSEEVSYKEWNYRQDANFYDKWKSVIRANIINSIGGIYSSGTAGKVTKDLNNILKDHPFDVKEISLETAMNNSGYKSKDAFYKLIMGELTLKKPLSLVDGVSSVITAETIWDKIDKDHHHFLPSKCKKYDSVLEGTRNNLRNIFLISSDENRKKISNKDPFDYIFSEINKDIFDIKANAKSHFVDLEDWEKLLIAKTDEINQEQKTKILEEIWMNRRNNILKHFSKKWSMEFIEINKNSNDIT